MMTISSIINELYTSERPVAKAVHKSANCKGICIGFKQGMQLKEHQAHKPTTLLVLNGTLKYNEGENVVHLCQFEQHEIPVGVTHAVEAVEDSLILLIQG